MEGVHLTWRPRSGKPDLPIETKPGIMPELTGLILELATLAQSAEQTLRKRQVKGSNPLGGLIDTRRPQQLPVGAFVVSSTRDRWHRRQPEGPLCFRADRGRTLAVHSTV